MKRADMSDMQRTLRETGRYETPASRRRRFVLPSFLATPVLRVRMLLVYIRSWMDSFHKDYADNYWHWSGYRVMRSVEAMGGVFECEGFENVNKLTGPAVLASNHMSSLETYLFPPLFLGWRNIAYVYRASLLKVPFFGRVLAATNPISVAQKSPVADLRRVLELGKKATDGGRFVAIFPQGHRARLFDPRTYNTLATKLAQHAGVPVLPVCVQTDFIRVGQLHRDLFASCHPRSIVRVAIGEPLPPTLSAAELQSAQIDFITKTLARWEKIDGRPMLGHDSFKFK